ncbi:MAG: phosphate signaling complex protein PhoU [Actinomycetota bacterium]
MPRKTFHEELKELQDDVVKMGERVEVAVRKSLEALLNKDRALADEVVREDDIIDEMNMAIEERSLRMLARQQPVARDLRLISSILKIVIHLERIGDYAFNIAKVTRRLDKGTESKLILDVIKEMASSTQDVVANSVKVFKERDVNLAHSLAEMDNSIDEAFKRLLRELTRCVRDESCDVDWSTAMILASRNIERLADHAVDIGEQVIYLVTGEMEELD